MSIQVVEYGLPDAPERFTQSLRETGFAVLANHPIDYTLVQDAYRQWHDFFMSDDKYNYPFDPKAHDGLSDTVLSETAKGSTVRDLKEFYHYYTWGRCPEYLKPITTQLYNTMSDLAHTLLSWVEAHMPEEARSKLSMPLSDMIKDSERTLLRPIHYPPLTGDEEPGAIRAAAHEDIDLLTVLPAATAKGLQVQSKTGEWLDVPCEPSWMIVNTGDMLQECTGGYYPATTHRVINPVGEDTKKARLAIPLFFHPTDDVVLSERYTSGSFRLERYAELGLD